MLPAASICGDWSSARSKRRNEEAREEEEGLGGVRLYPRSVELDDDAREWPQPPESAARPHRRWKRNGAVAAMYCEWGRFLAQNDSRRRCGSNGGGGDCWGGAVRRRWEIAGVRVRALVFLPGRDRESRTSKGGERDHSQVNWGRVYRLPKPSLRRNGAWAGHGGPHRLCPLCYREGDDRYAVTPLALN